LTIRKGDDMEHPEFDERMREPLDEEERELMDPATWDWEGAEVVLPDPSPYTITELHLSRDELALLDRAAITEGMTVSAFLKHAALERALQVVPK
jgi:Protein of unknown function (DUF1778)